MGDVFAVQQATWVALMKALTESGDLGVPARLYDRAPRDTRWPYADFGGQRTIDLPEGLQEHRFTLNVYARGGEDDGKGVVRRVITTAKAILHDQALTLHDGSKVSLRLVYSDVLRSGQNSTQGIARLRAITEPSPAGGPANG